MMSDSTTYYTNRSYTRNALQSTFPPSTMEALISLFERTLAKGWHGIVYIVHPRRQADVQTEKSLSLLFGPRLDFLSSLGHRQILRLLFNVIASRAHTTACDAAIHRNCQGKLAV